MMTIVEMLERGARTFPQKTALIYGTSTFSYRDVNEIANCVANCLMDMGLQRGDRVGCLVRKSPEAIISFLGIAKAGGVFFSIDYHQPIIRLQEIINLTNPSAFFISSEFLPLISALKLPPYHQIVVIGDIKDKKFICWDDVCSKGSAASLMTNLSEDDTVYLNFTSGTTGVPKAARATHANVYWNTLSAIQSLGLKPEDTHLSLFPVFGHPHELFARALYLGGTSVLVDSISPKAIAKSILDNNVSCMMAVASIYASMIRFHRSNPFDSSSVRIFESGGMHITPSLRKDFEREFEIPLLPVWGSTETTGIALFTPHNKMSPMGSMGKPCPYYEIKILGGDGLELPPGLIGEMAIKGPGVSKGYFEDPDETENYIKDGWFLTGDLVKRDEDNYYYFASRKTGMMKVAGMKVYPSEIENVLGTHPAIIEAAVTRTSDSLHGEIPKAVVVLNDSAGCQAKDLIAYCKKWLPAYKVPKEIDFVSELPKTSGGKILYRDL